MGQVTVERKFREAGQDGEGGRQSRAGERRGEVSRVGDQRSLQSSQHRAEQRIKQRRQAQDPCHTLYTDDADRRTIQLPLIPASPSRPPRSVFPSHSQGNRITPSYVGFAAGSGERLVGDAAKNQAPQNPENTVFDASECLSILSSPLRHDSRYSVLT